MQSIRRTVAVLSGTVFLVMIGISIVVPALPQYGLFFGASPFLAGVLVGALPMARVLLDLPAGAMGDRFGNRRLMMSGLAIIAITSAFAVVAFNYWVLLGVRFAEGIGSAFYVTSSLATLAKRVPSERRGRYMGIYVNALLLGQILGPVIGGIAVLSWGIRAPFAMYAILACVGMMLITFALEPEAEATSDGRVDFKAVRRLLSDRSYLIVTSGTMAAFFVRAGLITTVIPLFIALNWNVSSILAITYTGVLITTNALSQLLTLYPSGLLADRFGRKIPFVTSLVLVGLIAPFLFYARDLASAIPIMFLYGLALGLHGPLVAWTTDLTPKEIMGTSMGLYRTIGDLGFLLGPVILAAVLEITLVNGRVTIVPFLVAAAWAIAAGLLMLLARDPIAEKKRTEEAAHPAEPGNAT
ncbi:MAG TPA: MFS transporter [Thermoplasmata archaeon]|nr:MFS transporter [Thermoplasmata archaeon]